MGKAEIDVNDTLRQQWARIVVHNDGWMVHQVKCEANSVNTTTTMHGKHRSIGILRERRFVFLGQHTHKQSNGSGVHLWKERDEWKAHGVEGSKSDAQIY